MSRKVLILAYQPDPAGPVFGRVSDPLDFLHAQDWSHDHIDAVARDLLMSGAGAAVVSGFDPTVGAGLSLSIAAGEAFGTDGTLYDTLPSQANAVAFAAADPSQPRIDLVVARMDKDSDQNILFRPHRRLRTQAEVAAGTIFDDTNYDVATERQNRVVLVVKQGTPGASPIAQSAGANEAPLYQVRINAGVTTLNTGNVTDVRNKARSLASLLTAFDNINETIDDRINALIVVTPNTGIQKSYDDPGNAYTLAGVAATGSAMGMMSAADKAKLDAATPNDTPSTLSMRDSSGNVRHNEARVDAGVRFMPDNTLRRSAFAREDFLDLIEEQTPIAFNGAVVGVYETIKRVAATNGSGFTASVEYDLYIDPADYGNVSFKMELYALEASGINDSDVQLYNATDAVALANINLTWLYMTYNLRSPLFTIGGSGLKRLVVRARNNSTIHQLDIWRVRLVINPSF